MVIGNVPAEDLEKKATVSAGSMPLIALNGDVLCI
jgi:hypothetical protein